MKPSALPNLSTCAIFRIMPRGIKKFTGLTLVMIAFLNVFSYGQTTVPKLAKFQLNDLTSNYSKEYLSFVFDRAISDSVKIVGLGEVSHGGYEPMAFKANMVKYLIEKRGYRKVLFEFSDMVGIRLFRNYLNSHNANDTVAINKWFNDTRFNKAITSSWMDVLKWVKRYNDEHPKDMVEVAGFDVDTDASITNFILNKYIIPNNYKEGQNFVYQFVSGINDAQKIDLINRWFASNQASLKAKLDKQEFDWLNFYVHNAVNGLKYLIKEAEKKAETPLAGNVFRDSVMFENVKFLSKGAKCILWAHNGHVVKSGFNYMGNYLYQHLGNRYYVIATDFSKFAAVDVTSKEPTVNGYKKYLTKIYKSGPNTAGVKILDKYGISEGIFFHEDLINMNIKEETNLIDAFGVYLVIPDDQKSFDALVLFANIYTTAK